LEEASEDLLCQQNDFGQNPPLRLIVRQDNTDIVKLFANRNMKCLSLGNMDGDPPCAMLLHGDDYRRQKSYWTVVPTLMSGTKSATRHLKMHLLSVTKKFGCL
jgi:hypothetical protein